jgi:chaperonin GroES
MAIQVERAEPQEPAIEILEDDPNVVMNPDGSVEIPLEPEGAEEFEADPEAMEFGANLAEFLDEGALAKIGTDVLDGYTSDKESRAEHEKIIEHGIDLLGLKLEMATEPFQGACNATHPILLETAVKFEAKAIQELYPPGGPVKTQVYGSKTPEVQQKAARVKDFMDYQILEQIPDFYDEDERLLISLPLVGTSFKKLYWDEVEERPSSEFIRFEQFHIDYYARSLETAHRYTHTIYLSPNELRKRQAAGVYRDVDLGQPVAPAQSDLQKKIDQVTGLSAPQVDQNPQYVILEQHVTYYVADPLNESEDIALPYIISVDQTSKQVLSIRRNWDPADAKRKKLLWFSAYKYVPGFGFYGLGLPHLLGNLADAATYALRAINDAGQFSNLPAGFKKKGFRIVGANNPLRPGEWRECEFVGEDIRQAVMSLPYKGPDQTLFAMLQFMDERGQRFADSTEKVVADSTNYGPVGTTLALLEASTRFYASIFKRVHQSRAREFSILYKINGWYLPDEYPYDPANADRKVFKSDFDGSVQVQPVSDPNIPSMSHRLAKATTILDIALKTPQVHDMREAVVRVYQAMEVQDIEKLVPAPPQSYTGDPVSENMMAMMNRPIQVAPYQDHEAHISTHRSFAEDPNFGASELGQAAQKQLQAHIKEHMAFAYKRLMEMAKGAPIQVGQQLPPEMEIPLSQEEAALGEKIRSFGISESPEAMMAAAEKLNSETKARAQDHTEVKDMAQLALELREQDIKEAQVLLDAIEAGEKAKAELKKISLKADADIAKAAVTAALKPEPKAKEK